MKTLIHSLAILNMFIMILIPNVISAMLAFVHLAFLVFGIDRILLSFKILNMSHYSLINDIVIGVDKDLYLFDFFYGANEVVVMNCLKGTGCYVVNIKSKEMDYALENESQLNWEDEINRKIKEGLIDKDLKPLKCECGCTEFLDKNEYYIGGGHGIAEYDRHCKECGELVGSWSHGSWQF